MLEEIRQTVAVVQGFDRSQHPSHGSGCLTRIRSERFQILQIAWFLAVQNRVGLQQDLPAARDEVHPQPSAEIVPVHLLPEPLRECGQIRK